MPQDVKAIIRKMVPVTPNDTTTFAKTLGIYIGGTGNIQVDFVDSPDDPQVIAVVAGDEKTYSVIRVYDTNTTATDIRLIY